MTDAQNRLLPVEDLTGLDTGGAQQPVLHPPHSPDALHDTVHHPPDERQVRMRTGLGRGEVGAAFRYALERLVNERARIQRLNCQV